MTMNMWVVKDIFWSENIQSIRFQFIDFFDVTDGCGKKVQIMKNIRDYFEAFSVSWITLLSCFSSILLLSATDSNLPDEFSMN